MPLQGNFLPLSWACDLFAQTTTTEASVAMNAISVVEAEEDQTEIFARAVDCDPLAISEARLAVGAMGH